LETQLQRARRQSSSTLLSDPARRGSRRQAANTATPDTHDYNEAETRDLYIDLLLKEAGWKLDQARTSRV
jgi:type I restriction enzyme R subunit